MGLEKKVLKIWYYACFRLATKYSKTYFWQSAWDKQSYFLAHLSWGEHKWAFLIKICPLSVVVISLLALL